MRIAPSKFLIGLIARHPLIAVNMLLNPGKSQKGTCAIIPPRPEILNYAATIILKKFPRAGIEIGKQLKDRRLRLT